MAFPAVTFTLVNGTTIKASDHNQNFQDIINGITDGTKDLTVNSLVTTAGIVCTTLTPGTVVGDLTFSGSATFQSELKGSRMLLPFGSTSVTGVDRFIGIGFVSAAELSYKMTRAGSIVGYSVGGVTTSFTSNFSAIFRIRKNAVTEVSSNTVTWTASSQEQHDTATISRGTNVFAAGDLISLQFDYQAGTAAVTLDCFVEVQFDT